MPPAVNGQIMQMIPFVRASCPSGEKVRRTKLMVSLVAAGVLVLASNPCALAHTDLTATQARDLIAATAGLVIVDVREPFEFCGAAGHIAGARNYPWNSAVLQARYAELPKSSPILVVCASGSRSHQAANFLNSKGFLTVYDMKAGMSAWQWETAPCKYGGGSGTADDPYQIATAADLSAIGANPGDWGMHFKLTADIDLSGFDGKDGRPAYNIIGPDALPETWEYDGTPFTGVFDGNGHVISHLTITGQRYLGLFGLVGSGAVVRNLGVAAVDIVGSEDIGAIAGGNGDLQMRHIQPGTVSGCYSTGAITGDYCVAGVVGRNYGTVTDCYSTVTVSANAWVGGLVGSNDDGIVTECYSAGAVAGVDASTLGGLVGFSPGTVLRCVWDTQTSGQGQGAGGVGLTTTEMMDPNALGLNGFGGDPNWVLDPGRDYPKLAWEGKAGKIIAQPNLDWLEGHGTADAPYRLGTPDHLIALGKASVLWDKHLTLSADIDLEPNRPGEHIFGQAVIPVFAGVLDANGHTIRHLTIEGQSFLALVGTLRSGAEVRKLGVVDVNVTGSGNYFGGLVANNSGTVSQCYSTGLVTGGAYAGGLVGYADYRGSVTGCYSAVAVGGAVSGGLVGYNGGALTRCYSTGVVTGYGVSHAGGLVADGPTYNVTACFWDTQTSGQATSAAGTGKATTEMQTASTFIDAGWDFVGETKNGTQDIWWIDEGKDYPRLSWENQNN